MEDQYTNESELQIDPSTATCLKETTSWTRFLAICMMICAGLMVFLVVIMLVGKDLVTQALEDRPLPYGKIGVAGLSIILVIIILIIVAFAYTLFRFSNETKKAIVYHDQQALENGISGLASYFAIGGVLGVLSLLAAICKLIL